MKIYRNMSFRFKLVSLCVFFACMVVLIGVVSFFGLREVEDAYGRITGQVMPKLEQANNMFAEYRRVRITLRTLGLPGITKEQEAEAISGVLEAFEHYEKANETYKSFRFIPGQKEFYDKVQEQWAQFKGVGERVLALQKSGKPEDKEAMIKIFFNDCPQAAKTYTVAIKDLLNFHKDKAAQRVQESKQAIAKTKWTMIGITAIGTVLGLLAGLLFSSLMAKSITAVTDNLSKTAGRVTSTAADMAATSQQLSEASTQQAASLQETSASLEEITAMISKASDSAETTSASSTESHRVAEEGRSAAAEMLNSMDEISQSNEAILSQVNESNQQMSDIVRVIQEIGLKTKVINEIVFQTKLLSFNASVEAARAGEHGKGFAVVAEEVGNLAQMSGNAAKEISEMLDQSISKVEKTVTETKTKVESLVYLGKQKVEAGSAVAKQCASVLDQIVDSASKVSSLSQEISLANKEQTQGVSEINKAMSELDAVTQKNATTAQEAASSASSLSSDASLLRQSIYELVSLVKGEANHQVLLENDPEENEVAKSKGETNILKFKNKSSDASVRIKFKKVAGESFAPSRDGDGFDS